MRAILLIQNDDQLMMRQIIIVIVFRGSTVGRNNFIDSRGLPVPLNYDQEKKFNIQAKVEIFWFCKRFFVSIILFIYLSILMYIHFSVFYVYI